MAASPLFCGRDGRGSMADDTDVADDAADVDVAMVPGTGRLAAYGGCGLRMGAGLLG